MFESKKTLEAVKQLKELEYKYKALSYATRDTFGKADEVLNRFKENFKSHAQYLDGELDEIEAVIHNHADVLGEHEEGIIELKSTAYYLMVVLVKLYKKMKDQQNEIDQLSALEPKVVYVEDEKLRMLQSDEMKAPADIDVLPVKTLAEAIMDAIESEASTYWAVGGGDQAYNDYRNKTVEKIEAILESAR